MSNQKIKTAIRVNFLLDENLHKKLRQAQAKKIFDKKTNVSFSQICNEYLREGMQ